MMTEHHPVFNNLAAREIVDVLNLNEVAVASIRVESEPPITVLVPEGEFFLRYLEELAACGEGLSLAEVHIMETVGVCFGDDLTGHILAELTEGRSGQLDWGWRRVPEGQGDLPPEDGWPAPGEGGDAECDRAAPAEHCPRPAGLENPVFNHLAAQTVVRVLGSERMPIISIRAASRQPRTILVPGCRLYRRYLDYRAAADEEVSLSGALFAEGYLGWYGPNEAGPIVVELTEDESGRFGWRRRRPAGR